MKYQIFVILALSLVSAHCFEMPSYCEDYKEIDGDISSLLCIVYTLCRDNGKNPALAENFFGCYNDRPGKDQFLGCMSSKFSGKYLDSQSNVEWACKFTNLWRLPMYGACVGPAMDKAGVNKTEAVTLVNKCQGAAVGLTVKA